MIIFLKKMSVFMASRKIRFESSDEELFKSLHDAQELCV